MTLNELDRKRFAEWCQAKAMGFDVLAESDPGNKAIHYANALAMATVAEQLTKEGVDGEEASQDEAST